MLPPFSRAWFSLLGEGRVWCLQHKSLVSKWRWKVAPDLRALRAGEEPSWMKCRLGLWGSSSAKVCWTLLMFWVTRRLAESKRLNNFTEKHLPFWDTQLMVTEQLEWFTWVSDVDWDCRGTLGCVFPGIRIFTQLESTPAIEHLQLSSY